LVDRTVPPSRGFARLKDARCIALDDIAMLELACDWLPARCKPLLQDLVSVGLVVPD
jgi:hypothetical protein